ncbi:EpsG family protein [Chryseobacterium sp. Tr-659]|uniref:EpsG family protein n=1 Tax=Chryseobacterium sp. Tr-659 TaxID=2608340 RepID=UPI00141FA6CE|nr:EpsG family protein [Chryseobacterium sp. Tr-659]NIF04293.1 EpsG family protein [Chryseobacterium sp. Tr-659]
MDNFNNTYYILYGSFGLITFLLAALVDKNNFRSNFIKLGLLYIVLFALLFGFRDLDVGSDTEMYSWQYNNSDQIENWGTDFFIRIIFLTLKFVFNDDPVNFFMLLAILFNGTIFLTSYYISKTYSVNIIFILFTFFSLFFYKTLGINIIRQGVSLGFLILGIVLLFNNTKNKILVISSFILSVLFHFTSIIPIALLFTINFVYKKIPIKYFYILYVISIILSFFNFGFNTIIDSSLISSVDERRSGYLDASTSDGLYLVGFKPQFVIFNSFFLLIFIYMKNRMDKINIKNSMYMIILETYIVLSCIFFLFFHIPYSDRWGVMSWILIPFLIIPYFNKKYNSKIPFILIIIGLVGIFIFFNNI